MIDPKPTTIENDEWGVVEKHLQRLSPVSSEETYARLAGYGFARRYLKGGIVADICLENVGYGTRLLAPSAKSVVGLTNSSEACNLASTVFSAPNVSYQKVDLPELPYAENYFDAVVALGVVEYSDHPAELAGEIKRVLKQDGLLLISIPDKQLHSNGNYEAPDHREAMYVPEFQEMLEQHFSDVRIYRQAVVAGGLIFRESETVSDMMIETARLSTISPSLDTEAPVAGFILALCRNDKTLNQNDGRPYLLLDCDGTVFDEYKDLSEDAELLRQEIQQMQETEVQAFRDALMLRESEIAYLKARESRLQRIENSRTWRLFWQLTSPFRRIRTKLLTLRGGRDS